MWYILLQLLRITHAQEFRFCCYAMTAQCLSCSAGMSVEEFCALPENSMIMGCDGDEIVIEIPETECMPGGWCPMTEENDIAEVWASVLEEEENQMYLTTQNLHEIGNPISARSQVVAGSNYQFDFADGTIVSAFQGFSSPIQITAHEAGAAVCEDNPEWSNNRGKDCAWFGRQGRECTSNAALENCCATCAALAIVECPMCDACPPGMTSTEETDDNGCFTCGCQEEIICPEVMCLMYCENGFVQDDNGCDTCSCVEEEPSVCSGQFGDVNCVCEDGYERVAREIPLPSIDLPIDLPDFDIPILNGRRKMAIPGEEAFCERSNSCMFSEEQNSMISGGMSLFNECLDLDTMETYEVTTYNTEFGEAMADGGSVERCEMYMFECAESEAMTVEEICASGCQVYNDGCNTCSCPTADMPVAACTEMFCFRMGDPYCMDEPEEEPSCADDGMCCPETYTCMRPRGAEEGVMECVGAADGLAPPMPCEVQACCRAFTLECVACAAGLDETAFCAQEPTHELCQTVEQEVCTGQSGDVHCYCEEGYEKFVEEANMPALFGRRKMAIFGEQAYCEGLNSCMFPQESAMAGPIHLYNECIDLETMETYEVTSYNTMNGELMAEDGSDMMCESYNFHCREIKEEVCPETAEDCSTKMCEEICGCEACMGMLNDECASECGEVVCPEVTCRMFCEHGWAKDDNGCDICFCAEEPEDLCPDVMCMMFCENGFVQDDNGCDTCQCYEEEIEECEGDLVWNECGSCPLMCGQEPQMCITMCMPQCQCPNGLWQTEDNRCVPARECPTTEEECTVEFAMTNYADCPVAGCWIDPELEAQCKGNVVEVLELNENDPNCCLKLCNFQCDEDEVVCPEVMCRIGCENGFVKDDNGCDTCECKEEVVCPEVMCMMYCENGFVKDEFGCDTCTCDEAEPSKCSGQRGDAQCICDEGFEKIALGLAVEEDFPILGGRRKMAVFGEEAYCADSNSCMFPQESMMAGPIHLYNECLNLETMETYEVTSYNTMYGGLMAEGGSTDICDMYIFDCMESVEVVCPEVTCRMFCEHGWAKDDNGCDICFCAEEPEDLCPDVMCFMFCENGFVQDDNGCDTCECFEIVEPECIPGGMCEITDMEEAANLWARAMEEESSTRYLRENNLGEMGEIVGARSQVVAGINYEFEFEDGTTFFVFENLSQTMQIMGHESNKSACPETQPDTGSSCDVQGETCEYGEYCCCGSCMATTYADCSPMGTWMIAVTAAMPCPDDCGQICCHALEAECESCKAGLSMDEYCEQNPTMYGCNTCEACVSQGLKWSAGCGEECAMDIGCYTDMEACARYHEEEEKDEMCRQIGECSECIESECYWSNMFTSCSGSSGWFSWEEQICEPMIVTAAPICQEGEIDSSNPCVQMQCMNGMWREMFHIDCPRMMGVPCSGTWIEPADDQCCAICEMTDCSNVACLGCPDGSSPPIRDGECCGDLTLCPVDIVLCPICDMCPPDMVSTGEIDESGCFTCGCTKATDAPEPVCEEGEMDNSDPCEPKECVDNDWVSIIVDCAEQMGMECLAGWMPAVEGTCCSTCPCDDIMCTMQVCDDGSNPPVPEGECCGDMSLCPTEAPEPTDPVYLMPDEGLLDSMMRVLQRDYTVARLRSAGQRAAALLQEKDEDNNKVAPLYDPVVKQSLQKIRRFFKADESTYSEEIYNKQRNQYNNIAEATGREVQTWE